MVTPRGEGHRTDQYQSGKYVRDGVYDPYAVDSQPGCAGLPMATVALGSTIKFADATMPSAGPTLTQKSSPMNPPPSPSIAHPSRGSIGAFIVTKLAAIFGRK